MKKNKKTNVWKIVAISSIALFLIILLLPFIRMFAFRPHFNQMQDTSSSQEEKAIELIKETAAEGFSVEDFNITVADKVTEIMVDKQKKQIVSVRLFKENESRSYLIDVDAWTVLQSTHTKSSIGMIGNYPQEREGRWFHNNFMDGKKGFR
jgi:hypothetical protein